MTAEKIKKEMAKMGVSVPALAEKMQINTNHLRMVLRGDRALTDSLARHIMLELQQVKTASVSFSVSLPDGACSYHLHAPEKLTDTEQQQVMDAVRAKIEAVSTKH